VVAPTPFFGDRGCHVRIYEEVRALARAGVECEILTYPTGRDVADLTIRRSTRRPGVRATDLGPSYSRPLLDLDLLASGLRLVRRFRPQVIHAHLHEGILIGGVLRRITRAPLVADLQGSLTSELIDHRFVTDGSLRARLIARLERWLVGQPDAIVASSGVGASLICAQGRSATRVEALPDGVDLDTFRPLGHDESLKRRLGLTGKRIVVFLGVLTAYQGVDALIESAPLVVARVPDAHFLIMGYPNEELYRARIRERGLERAITMPGRIPYEEAARHLALGTLAVSAKRSLTEANGKLLNYMACGLPVVATDTPVNREILGDEGVYAPVGDPHALADRIVELFGDDARRASLGTALRRRAESRYAWPILIQRLLKIYGRLAGEPVPVYATRPEPASGYRI
jgi:glycosyltransferase involved in cell wall biosynthesis